MSLLASWSLKVIRILLEMALLLTGYHNTSFDHIARQQAVKRVTRILRRFPRSVGIVCTGISGVLVAVPAAEKTNREFAIGW